MRRGPRPLHLHLTLAMLRSDASPDRSKPWNGDWPSWSREAVLQALQSAPSHDFAAFATRPDLALLINGIAAYRRHPWCRDLADPPTIWSEGGARLLDYGTAPDGIPVIFVPSLVNRAYVLDLRQGGSMMRWLAANGVRPFLLDWGWPGPLERAFTMTDYLAGRLERALEACLRAAGCRPVLAGYCMGGTMAVAAAQRRPDLVSGLALLAAPWDFHAPDKARARSAATILPMIEPVMAASRTMPVDVLQALFALLDPWPVANKYRRFATMDQSSAAAIQFVALEDWLNDGVPLAENVARACLRDWYGDNAPAQGNWVIAGLPVDPRQIRCPTFVAVPRRDRIVPPRSSLPLAALIEGAVLHQPDAGHIGMAAGTRAPALLWEPLLKWLRQRAGA
jgi:hypothetical protein